MRSFPKLNTGKAYILEIFKPTKNPVFGVKNEACTSL